MWWCLKYTFHLNHFLQHFGQSHTRFIVLKCEIWNKCGNFLSMWCEFWNAHGNCQPSDYTCDIIYWLAESHHYIFVLQPSVFLAAQSGAMLASLYGCPVSLVYSCHLYIFVHVFFQLICCCVEYRDHIPFTHWLSGSPPPNTLPQRCCCHHPGVRSIHSS